jgi:glycosyltransferase involved in cell wall biosynthesis
MPRILHMIDSLGVGGAEKLLVGIINELADFENHVLILRGPEILLPELEGIQSFHNLQAPSLTRALPKVWDLRQHLKKHGIDIVHSHLFACNVMARLAAPKSVKVINSIHAVSSQANYNITRTALPMEKLTYKKRHHIICVSQTVLDDFDKYAGLKGPSTVLYNFIERVYFPVKPKTEFSREGLKLVAVGNLRHQKNYPYLVEAFKQLPKNISLDIYGEGPLRGELQAEIDAYGLNIRLCGLRNNLYELLPQYDMFVMSSHFEGQPVSLLEAMACGLPALLSDIPVLREVGGEKAIYFSISDTGEFVRRITEIQQGRYDLAAMSAYSADFATTHAQKDQYMNRLRNIYLS